MNLLLLGSDLNEFEPSEVVLIQVKYHKADKLFKFYLKYLWMAFQDVELTMLSKLTQDLLKLMKKRNVYDEEWMKIELEKVNKDYDNLVDYTLDTFVSTLPSEADLLVLLNDVLESSYLKELRKNSKRFERHYGKTGNYSRSLKLILKTIEKPIKEMIKRLEERDGNE